MNDDNFFCLICFLILMQGLHGKESNYIKEKYKIVEIGNPEIAFSELDILNQKKVIDYCGFWKVALPEKVKKYCERVWAENHAT